MGASHAIAAGWTSTVPPSCSGESSPIRSRGKSFVRFTLNCWVEWPHGSRGQCSGRAGNGANQAQPGHSAKPYRPSYL